MLRRVLAVTFLVATLLLPGWILTSTPVAASCMGLSSVLPEKDAQGAVVFVGTVMAVDPIRTQLRVDAWFLGSDPAEVVIVLGGRQPGTITSADWVPSRGEQYAVVATRSPEGSLTTELCQQQLTDQTLVIDLGARFGQPTLPPFATGPSTSPSPIGSPEPAPSCGPGPDPSPSASAPSPSSVTSGDSPEPGSLVHDVDASPSAAAPCPTPSPAPSSIP